jgi:hypothetical protein
VKHAVHFDPFVLRAGKRSLNDRNWRRVPDMAYWLLLAHRGHRMSNRIRQRSIKRSDVDRTDMFVMCAETWLTIGWERTIEAGSVGQTTVTHRLKKIPF